MPRRVSEVGLAVVLLLIISMNTIVPIDYLHCKRAQEESSYIDFKW